MTLATFDTPADLLAAVRMGKLDIKDALDELGRREGIQIVFMDEVTPMPSQQTIEDIFTTRLDPIARGFDAFKAKLHDDIQKRWKKYELLKPGGQQVLFAGPLGRVRVTFTDSNEAILGLQKPSGAFKKVATLPWIFGKGDPHGHGFALNERLQELCGPDFEQVI